MSEKNKIVLTGSEGLIGKRLREHLTNQYEVLSLDLELGHDLTNERFVEDWFANNNELYGIIIGHSHNPIPLQETKKIEPTDLSLDELRDYLDVNLLSAFNICRHFIKNNSSGKIINISSLYGLVSPKHHIYNNFTKPLGYSVSKSALIMMSKYLSTYYAENFNINTVVFGGVYDNRLDQDFVNNFNRNVPMKRMMEIDEVLSVFDFLLDEKSSYVNGTEIIVDGGWTAW